jgi:hypothetical protein
MSAQQEDEEQSTNTDIVRRAPSVEDSEDKEESAERRVYDRNVRNIAEKGIYEFEFVEGSRTGERLKLPRQKISNRKMLELENDRADYAARLSQFRSGKLTREHRREAAEMLTNLYAKLAKYYFNIEREDFDNMDWDSTKPNIDAAANISIRGRPNLV